MASYYVVGGEYADTSFTIPAAGTEPEIYGPFNEREAKVRWRELTGKTVDNAMVRYFLKSEDELTAKTYWVIGGEYAETSFTRMQSGKELEVYGPFDRWDEALGFWRGLTSKSVDDALVRYDIRENYQPGDSVAGKWAVIDDKPGLQQNATKTVSVAKPPEKVMAYLKDARNWPKWAAHTFKTVREGKNGTWDECIVNSVMYDKGGKEAIYHKLIALGNNPEPNDVDATIGNGSWTRLTCNECGKEKEMVAEVGETPDWESNTANICMDCIDKLNQLTRQSVLTVPAGDC